MINNKQAKTNRFPIELFAKNEINNQQTKLLNSYRIRSAQTLAKQRSTGKSVVTYKCLYSINIRN